MHHRAGRTGDQDHTCRDEHGTEAHWLSSPARVAGGGDSPCTNLSDGVAARKRETYYLCLWEAPRAPSRLRRNERIGHPLRRDRMPGLAREHQDRLDVEPPERPPPLVDPR